MKIISLSASNFQILSAVEIKPSGNTVLITGKNGQGKSSVLEAIISTLCGKKYIPEKPLKTGTDHAETKIETENYIIKRTYTEGGGGSITITNKDGMKATSPQEMLDKLVGEIAFNPTLFMDYDGKEQKKILMKLTGLDFSDLDSQIETVKSERSSVRSVKEDAEREAAKIAIPANLPQAEISLAALNAKMTEAINHNAAQQKILNEITSIETSIARIEDSLKNESSLISNLEKQLQAARDNHGKNLKLCSTYTEQKNSLTETLKPVVDTAFIQQEINTIEITNQTIRTAKTKTELLAKVQAKIAEYAELGKKMKSLEEEKAARLAAVKMPIEGLSVNEDGLVFKGIPLSQVNDAKKLEICVGIGMAMNPKLKVILMKGNDLDSESLKAVEAMAAANDYQIWIEKIDETGKVGIVIEDGSVVATNPPQQEAAGLFS